MKYLIAEDFSGHPVPFLFPDRVQHADMREQLPYSTILSGGYVALVDGNFVCSGGDAEIETLARPEDAAVITSHFASSNG